MKKKIIIIFSCCATLLLALGIFYVSQRRETPHGAYYCHPLKSVCIIYKDGTCDYEKYGIKHLILSGTWNLENGILTFSFEDDIQYEYHLETDSFSYYHEDLEEELIWEKLE